MRAPRRTIGAAKRLRKKMTPPEVQLWVRLRGASPPFRRQHPMGPYVLDFYCARLKLAIEVDDLVHDSAEQVGRDAARDAWLRARGVTVMRLPAAELWTDPDSVADGVLHSVAAMPPQSLRDSSPASGGAAKEASLLPCEAGEGNRAQPGGGGATRAPDGSRAHG